MEESQAMRLRSVNRTGVEVVLMRWRTVTSGSIVVPLVFLETQR